MGTVALCQPPKHAAASRPRHAMMDLGLYLLWAFAGQLMFAFLASVPVPALESNVIVPMYIAVWALAYTSEPVARLLTSAPMVTLARASGTCVGCMGITVYGIDWAAQHGPTHFFRTSAVAGLALAVLPAAAGTLIINALVLLWPLLPAATMGPLPLAAPLDLGFYYTKRAAIIGLAYYLVMDPHGYASAVLTVLGQDGATFYSQLQHFIPPATARCGPSVAPPSRGPRTG